MSTLDHIAEALAAVASAQVSASQDAADLRAATDQVAALSTVVVEQRDTITAQAATIDTLEARIAELEGEEPPPPPQGRPMLIGASVQQRAGESWAQALARFESSVSTSAGAPFKCQVVRRFTSGIPTPSTSVFLGLEGYHRIFSFKGNASVAQLVTWLQSLPVDGNTTYVASWHEPENDLTRDQFLARQAILETAIAQAGRADVQKTIIVMGWWERDGNPGTTSATFWPDDLTGWVVGFDMYDRHQNAELASIVTPSLDLLRARGGSRWMLAECATKRKGADAAGWIERAGAWIRAEGCETFPWFDSKQGDDQGVPLGEGFFLDLRGPTAEAAFARLVG